MKRLNEGGDDTELVYVETGGPPKPPGATAVDNPHMNAAFIEANTTGVMGPTPTQNALPAPVTSNYGSPSESVARYPATQNETVAQQQFRETNTMGVMAAAPPPVPGPKPLPRTAAGNFLDRLLGNKVGTMLGGKVER